MSSIERLSKIVVFAAVCAGLAVELWLLRNAWHGIQVLGLILFVGAALLTPGRQSSISLISR